jgi:alkylation response protein AidB-like acyl-CoA dehydrogenase
MNFDFTDDQHQIKRTAREFLAARYKPETIRELAESETGFTDEGWQEMAELGWHGIAIPEEHGGQGLGIVDLVVILEEMGYALAPGPFFSNAVTGYALSQAASDEVRAELLPAMASGERRATLAWLDAGSRNPGDFRMEPRKANGGVVLEGEKVLVPDAASAAWLVIPCADGSRHVVETDADGVTIEPAASIDSTRKLYSVKLAGVEVPASRSFAPDPPAVIAAVSGYVTALAAESVGVAQRTMEMAVEYARERKQFGRAIGSYQAVSHRCAEMLLETEGARSLTYYAAWACDNEPDTAPLAAAMAKAYASDAGFRVPASALQVHGGIGFTWEHDLHLWLKRGKANAATFGDARFHRDVVAALTGLGGEAARAYELVPPPKVPA